MPEELGSCGHASARRLAKATRRPRRPLAGLARRRRRPSAAQAYAPLNAGFQALGAAGKTETMVGGPARFEAGDGTYRVIQNDPLQMVFTMKTGYVDGRFTLSRDAATGKDTLGFTGQTKDGPFSGWTQSQRQLRRPDHLQPAGSDSGAISWQLNGAQVNDTYRGGRAGSRSMTITLKGNDAHLHAGLERPSARRAEVHGLDRVRAVAVRARRGQRLRRRRTGGAGGAEGADGGLRWSLVKDRNGAAMRIAATTVVATAAIHSEVAIGMFLSRKP